MVCVYFEESGAEYKCEFIIQRFSCQSVKVHYTYPYLSVMAFPFNIILKYQFRYHPSPLYSIWTS